MAQFRKTKQRDDFLRYAGNLEKVSIYRYSLGLLGPVAVTGRYSFPRTNPYGPDMESVLYPAIRAVIAQHPALSCGIIDEDGAKPAFIRLKTINLTEHVCFSDTQTDRDNNEVLESFLANAHSHSSFRDISAHPPWKVHFFPHATGTGLSENFLYDVSFVFHHALIDGLSGTAFHSSLLKALNDPKVPKDTSHTVHIRNSTILSPPVEDHLRLKVTTFCLVSKIWEELRPAWINSLSSQREYPWTGGPALTVGASSLSTQLRILEFDKDAFQKMLDRCRELRVTFTTMLHGIIVVCLSFHVYKAETFVADTPFSVRKFTNTSPLEMVNQASLIKTTYSKKVLDFIRNPNTTLGPTAVASIGSSFSHDLQKSKEKFPVDDMLSLLKLVPDLKAFFQKKLGKRRGASFEISNLGAWSDTSEFQSNSVWKWEITRLLLTQAGSIIGNAFNFNVASVKSGPLTISVTWQAGCVGVQEAEDVVQGVRKALRRLADHPSLKAGPGIETSLAKLPYNNIPLA